MTPRRPIVSPLVSLCLCTTFSVELAVSAPAWAQLPLDGDFPAGLNLGSLSVAL